MDDRVKLIVVHTYGNRIEADLAKAALETAGIRAMVQGDSVGGMREHLAWSGAGFKIFVREEDLEEARKALTPAAGEVDEGPDDLEAADDTWPPFRRFT